MTFVISQQKIMEDDIEARNTLEGCAWLQSLPKSSINKLLLCAHWRAFNKGQLLFHEGERMSHCLLLESGHLEIFRYTAEGNEKIFDHIKNKGFLALPAIFMAHGRYPMNVRALENGRALELPRGSIHQICLQHPEAGFQLLCHVCDNLYEMVNRIDWLTSSSTSERLAEYILKQYKKNTEKNAFLLPLNRVQLATHLGVRYETLIRLMSKWKKKKYISLEKNKVQVLNLHALQQLSQTAQRNF